MFIEEEPKRNSDNAESEKPQDEIDCEDEKLGRRILGSEFEREDCVGEQQLKRNGNLEAGIAAVEGHFG